MGDILKIHVHTDPPEAVFTYAAPDSVLDRHRIALVPLQVMFGDSTFRDRVELKPEEFYRRLGGSSALPATPQPGTHVGPGAWGIFYQVEDGLPGPDDQGGPHKG